MENFGIAISPRRVSFVTSREKLIHTLIKQRRKVTGKGLKPLVHKLVSVLRSRS